MILFRFGGCRSFTLEFVESGVFFDVRVTGKILVEGRGFSFVLGFGSVFF